MTQESIIDTSSNHIIFRFLLLSYVVLESFGSQGIALDDADFESTSSSEIDLSDVHAQPRSSQRQNHNLAASPSRSRSRSRERVTIVGDGWASRVLTKNIHVIAEGEFEFDESAACFGELQFQWREERVYHLYVNLSRAQVKKNPLLEMLGVTRDRIEVQKLKGKDAIAALFIEKRESGDDFSSLNAPRRQGASAEEKEQALEALEESIDEAVDAGETEYYMWLDSVERPKRRLAGSRSVER